MALAVALDLGDFNQRLAGGTSAGIIRRNGSSARLHHFKHQAVRNIAVMRNGEHLTAGFLFIGVHIVPQLVDRIGAFGLWVIGTNLVGPRFAIAKDDNAVQIVAIGHERIFKAHERSELAGLVIALDDAGMALPNLHCAFGLLFAWQNAAEFAFTSSVDQFHRCALAALMPFMHHIVPAQQRRILDHHTRRIIKPLGRAKAAAMIGDNKEIERSVELCLQAPGRFHFFAARKTQRLFRPKLYAKAKCVDRIGSMQMGITPQQFGRDAAGDFLVIGGLYFFRLARFAAFLERAPAPIKACAHCHSRNCTQRNLAN